MLPVLALTSLLADLELVATRRLRSMQRRYLAGLGLTTGLAYLGICALALPPSVVAIMTRSWPAWFGTALLAGAVLGWRLAWTLPATIAAALTYWGYRGGQGYHWWEFTARPYDDLPSLLLSSALLIVGLVAYEATPWRRRWLLGWLTQRIRKPRRSLP